MLRSALLACAVLIAGTAAASATPTLLNGSFESSSYTSNTEFGTRFGGQGVTSWTGTGYALYFIGGTQSIVNAANEYGNDAGNLLRASVGLSPDGGNFVALDGDSSFQGGTAAVPGSMLSQAVTGLTPGLQYDVSFSWGATQLVNRSGNTTEQLQVTFGDATQSTTTLAVASGGFSGWLQESFRFTASSAEQALSFLSYGTPNGLPPIALLDGVAVQQAVPEPASWALMGAGLLGAAAGTGAARRRARVAVRA